jgi:ATP-dependent RNA helicase RhlE
LCGSRSRASGRVSRPDAEKRPDISRLTFTEGTGRREGGFDRFNLRPELLRAIAEAGFSAPRPVQEQAIPPALAGRDVLGLAQTGTGKTAAFVLPILQHLLGARGPRRTGPRALVVAPTRELAAQSHAEFERLAKFTQLRATSVFGGVPIPRQVRALRLGPDIVVACPGRLLDLMGQGALRLDAVEVLVLDEADHMFDMGFVPDVRRILRALPARRQNLLYSATMPSEIRKLADTVLHKPAVIELGNSRPAETIAHAIYSLEENEKVGALERLLAGDDFTSAIVFLRTKRRAKRLAERLDQRGHAAVAMQGNMSQPQRERALLGFRGNRFDVLVATDVAARGLDIAGVSHVVNFDVPNTPDAYTHRIGRTGRAEQTGKAFTFVTGADGDALRAIEKRLGAPIERRQLSELGPIERSTLSAGKSRGRGARPPARPTRSSRSRPAKAWSSRTRSVPTRSAARTATTRSAVGTEPARSAHSTFGQGVGVRSAQERGPKPSRARRGKLDVAKPTRRRRRRA